MIGSQAYHLAFFNPHFLTPSHITPEVDNIITISTLFKTNCQNQSETYMKRIWNHRVGKHQSFNCKKCCEAKRNNMQAAKCGLGLNRNGLADSLDYDIILETNPIDMIQVINQK